MEKVSGLTCDEVLGRSFLDDIVDYDERDAVQDVFSQVYHSQKSARDFRFTLYSKGNLRRDLLLNVFPDFDKETSAACLSIYAWHAPLGRKGRMESATDVVRGAIRVLECRAATSEKEDLGSDSETKTQCPSTEELPDISSMGTTPYTSVGESYGSEGIGLTRCQSEENVAEICDREEAA